MPFSDKHKLLAELTNVIFESRHLLDAGHQTGPGASNAIDATDRISNMMTLFNRHTMIMNQLISGKEQFDASDIDLLKKAKAEVSELVRALSTEQERIKKQFTANRNKLNMMRSYGAVQTAP